MANGANATSSASLSWTCWLSLHKEGTLTVSLTHAIHRIVAAFVFPPPPPPPQVHNSKGTSKKDHSLTLLGAKFIIEPHPFHCSPSKHSHPVADKSAEKQLKTSAELSSSFCSPLRLKPNCILPRSKAEMVRSKLAHSQLQLKGSIALKRLG